MLQIRSDLIHYVGPVVWRTVQYLLHLLALQCIIVLQQLTNLHLSCKVPYITSVSTVPEVFKPLLHILFKEPLDVLLKVLLHFLFTVMLHRCSECCWTCCSKYCYALFFSVLLHPVVQKHCWTGLFKIILHLFRGLLPTGTLVVKTFNIKALLPLFSVQRTVTSIV